MEEWIKILKYLKQTPHLYLVSIMVNKNIKYLAKCYLQYNNSLTLTIIEFICEHQGLKEFQIKLEIKFLIFYNWNYSRKEGLQNSISFFY